MAGHYLARERLFADDYSSTGQRAWKESKRGPGYKSHANAATESDPFWRANLLGQMRFDTLVSRRVVIADSHLLDGAFFLATRPSRLAGELGRPDPMAPADEVVLPLVFRLRAPTLEETLRRFLVVPGRPTLNGFTFRSVPETAAQDALAEELRTRTPRELERYLRSSTSPAIAVAALLRDCLVARGYGDLADESIGPLEAGWSYLLEEERYLPIEQYQTNENFRPADVLHDEPILPGAERLTDAANSALREIEEILRSGAQNRSAVTAVLRRYRAQTPDEATREGLTLIDQWYTRARYRAIAHQHGAAFVQLLTDVEPFGPLQRLCARITGGADFPQTTRIELPDDCLTGLGDLADADWRRFLTQASRPLHDWWRTGDVDHFKQAVSDLGDILAPERKSQTLFGMVIPDAATAAVAGAEAAFIASQVGAPTTLAALIGPVVAAVAGSAQASGQPQRAMHRRMVDIVRQMTRTE